MNTRDVRFIIIWLLITALCLTYLNLLETPKYCGVIVDTVFRALIIL